MLITPHIHYFVLVSAVLISAVHAIPIQPGAQPEAHHRTPRPVNAVTVQPGSPSVHSNTEAAVHGSSRHSTPQDSPLHSDADPPIVLPKSKWGPRSYRATVLEFDSDKEKSPTRIPYVGTKFGSALRALLGEKAGPVTYVNEPIPVKAGAKEANTQGAIGRDAAKLMTIFVLEAKSDDDPCGGDWPCLGWIRLDQPQFYSMYHINPSETKLKRISHDGSTNLEILGKDFDADFFGGCVHERSSRELGHC